MSKTKLKLLILLNLTWTILGFIADYDWLSRIPPYLIPLTAICSLYPPLLLIWYTLQYFEKKTPAWFTYWLILATSTYGLIAQFYFPLLMSWVGLNFHDAGSMAWVAVYGLQSLILLPYLRLNRFRSIIPGLIYLFAADFSHYFALTFVDFTRPGYPVWMKNLTALASIAIQLAMAALLYRKTRQTRKNTEEPSTPTLTLAN